MAAAVLVPRHIITTTTALPSHILVNRQVDSKSYAYPACAEDADGPCQQSESSYAACESQFATVTGPTFNQFYYCMCTNGYYERSSECWFDCYPNTQATPDPTSISRESRLHELACESYSLEMDSELAVNSGLTFTANETSAMASRTTSNSIYGGATVGATASANAEETAPWVERPTASGPGQQSSSAQWSAKGGLAGMGGKILILLVLSSYMPWSS
ncbi:hypothetical protein AA0120_g1977 [Alternaria tenuissima]|nr:hypothetical protein AA0120_g1977 [Alternaria tenuissima]